MLYMEDGLAYCVEKVGDTQQYLSLSLYIYIYIGQMKIKSRLKTFNKSKVLMDSFFSFVHYIYI